MISVKYDHVSGRSFTFGCGIFVGKLSGDGSARAWHWSGKPAPPLEKTSAAALSTPPETVAPAASKTAAETAPNQKTAADTAPSEPGSPWHLSLSDIEAFLSRIIHPSQPKAESPANGSATAR